MNKFKMFVLKAKSLIIPILICLFTLFLIVFSNTNLYAAKKGLSLWANSVVPSLLPFFIATELLGYTNIISILGKLLNKFMRPLFNVPGEGSFPFIMGIISGYPVGAKIVSDFKNQGLCTNIEAERLIAFTNNSGPLFIVGTVGIGLFKDTKTGILLLITHILACITVGILFRWWKSGRNKRSCLFSETSCKSPSRISLSNLGEVLANSIMNSISTIFLIGGFVVLFSVVISILNNSGILNLFVNLISPLSNGFGISDKYLKGIITGLIELTNGVCNIALIANKNISTNIIICSFLLGFGGISVALQVLSITSKNGISIKPYLIGKLLQGTFAAIYTYIFLNTFCFLNLNL
ncbi:MAG: sporulation integral membrane protein YlbJ [Clostridia bacterium]